MSMYLSIVLLIIKENRKAHPADFQIKKINFSIY